MSATRKKNGGFTLIEVVLVLAIGGLIFLLAFLAFGQVQRNRRDSQKRQDINRIFAEMVAFNKPLETGLCWANLNGSDLNVQPATCPNLQEFITNVKDLDWHIPQGGSVYRLSSSMQPNSPGRLVYVAYRSGLMCNSGNPGSPVVNPNSSGGFVVWTLLESGGHYCRDTE